MWTKSACVVLAWGIIVMIVVVAAGLSQPARPAPASIRIASKTTEIAGVAAVFVTTAPPAARYVIQPGDTLSGIAAALAVPGGWPALYAANRARIGPDPGLIRPGTVLAIPHPAVPRAPVPRPGHRLHPPTPPPGPASGGQPPLPGRTAAPPTAAGMPSWLKTMLLTAGLAIGAAFLAEPVLLIRRRRRARPGPPGSQRSCHPRFPANGALGAARRRPGSSWPTMTGPW